MPLTISVKISLFIKFKLLCNEELTVAIDASTFPIEGNGLVDLIINGEIVRFNDVMYSLSLRYNLISGSRLDANGAKFKGGEGRVKVYSENGTLFRAILKNGICFLYPNPTSKTKKDIKSNEKPKKVCFQASTIQKDDLKLWHRRLGHISSTFIEHTVKCNGIRGLPQIKCKDIQCKTCKLNKHR